LRLAATEESDPERAGHMLLMQRNSQSLSSARPWTMRQRRAAQARLEECDGKCGSVWHDSCAPTCQALSPVATREFVVSPSHAPYLLHEQALPLSCAIVAARRVRALVGHFPGRTRIGRFHAFGPMTMLRALVMIRSLLPKPQ